VLQSTLLSFVKQFKLNENNRPTINFRTRIEETTLAPDSPDYQPTLARLNGQPGLQRVLEFSPDQDWKFSV
jgi:hypothetical protein